MCESRGRVANEHNARLQNPNDTLTMLASFKDVASAIDSLAADLFIKSATVQDGYTYRENVAAYMVETNKLINGLLPELIVRGDGSVDRGTSPNTIGKFIPTEAAWSDWNLYRSHAASGRGVKNTFAGVKNYLCGDVMPHW